MLAADLGPAVIGLLGVLAGGLITGFLGLMTLNSTLKGQQAQRDHEVAMATEARDAERRLAKQRFQADTLVELEFAIARYNRSTTAVLTARRTAHERDQALKWTSKQLGEAHYAEHMDSNTLVLILTVRVEDDAVRATLEDGRNAGYTVLDVESQHEAEQAYASFMTATGKALQRIGYLLRDLPPPAGPPLRAVAAETPIQRGLEHAD